MGTADYIILAFILLNVIVGCINVCRHDAELGMFSMLTAILLALLAIWFKM